MSGKSSGKGDCYDVKTGFKYSGEWYDDRRHGYGVLTSEDGVFAEGNWV